MAKAICEYNLSFESGGKKVQAQQSGFDIHDVIKRVRKEYPDAKMFRVLKKSRYPHPIG